MQKYIDGKEPVTGEGGRRSPSEDLATKINNAKRQLRKQEVAFDPRPGSAHCGCIGARAVSGERWGCAEAAELAEGEECKGEIALPVLPPEAETSARSAKRGRSEVSRSM